MTSNSGPDAAPRADFTPASPCARDEFFGERDQILAAMESRLAMRAPHPLKELWMFGRECMCVSYEYEWCDENGQWVRSHGREQWEFTPDGLMHQSEHAQHDVKIDETERRYV